MPTLVIDDDLSSCRTAIDSASRSRNASSVQVELRRTADRDTVSCELLVLPLEPMPSCVFVFLPTPGERSGTPILQDLSTTLLRLGHATASASPDRRPFGGVTERQVRGLTQLTLRESEIVSRLVDGDRVPAIASSLYLGQSTVRNHLASVFAKLGVSSQQELLDLIRAARSQARE